MADYYIYYRSVLLKVLLKHSTVHVFAKPPSTIHYLAGNEEAHRPER